MDISSLKEIGLTDGEVKVYLALLKLGATKTGLLATNAGVSSSKVYKILARLEKKGLTSHVIESGVAFYRALEPKRILDYIKEEKERLEEKEKIVESLLPALEKQMKSTQKMQATIYTGFSGVKNFFMNILDDISDGEAYYVIGAKYTEEIAGQRLFFQKYHSLRAQKKIKVMYLANNNARGTLVPATKLLAQIRYLPNYLITDMQIVFYKNKSFIIIWRSEPMGFLIESEECVESFKKYFDTFWKIAKK